MLGVSPLSLGKGWRLSVDDISYSRVIGISFGAGALTMKLTPQKLLSRTSTR